MFYKALHVHVGVFPVELLPVRLVFTNNGVVVGVVISIIEKYDLVKIKPTESEAEHSSAYDSVAYDQVKTALSESQTEVEVFSHLVSAISNSVILKSPPFRTHSSFLTP